MSAPKEFDESLRDRSFDELASPFLSPEAFAGLNEYQMGRLCIRWRWRALSFVPSESVARESSGIEAERGNVTDVVQFEGEWAMEWLGEEKGENSLTGAGIVEPVGDVGLEYDTPPLTQAISDAIDQKNWPRVVELAMQVGWYDQNRLTNLLFFSRHPELDRRSLKPQASKQDEILAREWNQILVKEVRPAIERAAEDRALEVSGGCVAERDPQLSGEKGGKFKALVAWAAKEVGLDPGFLAAVLLAEVGSADPYLNPNEVRSFFTGTDDFFAQRAQLRINVPAFAQVHFDERRRQQALMSTAERSPPFLTTRAGMPPWRQQSI